VSPSGSRVGLYGGSFDPPHLAHVLAATFALCRAGLDELRIVPAHQHAFGKRLAPFEARCRMLELALAHLGPRVVIDPIEQRLGGVSYTLHTVRAVREQRPDATIVWIGGADSWASRLRWHRWDELEPLVEPFIFGRDGTPTPPDLDVACDLPAVSSTGIRAAVAAGQPVDLLVGPEVAAFIAREGLYR
jgi:nicotinate-nucleotide adenylyltransferase